MCTCCGMSLRTGGLIIGWLEVICSSLALGVILLVQEQFIKNAIEDELNINEDFVRKWAWVYITICAISVIINIIAASMLLNGIYKNISRRLIPYLVITVISAVITCICLIPLLIVEAKHTFLRYLFTLALQLWFLRVVYLLYKQIRGTEQQQQQPSPEAGVGYVAYAKA